MRPDNTRFLHAAQQARHAALLDKARTALRQTELDRLRQQTAPLLDQLREQAATRPAALLHLAISCLDVLH